MCIVLHIHMCAQDLNANSSSSVRLATSGSWSSLPHTNEEIESHLQMALQGRIDRGESPQAAKGSALREFGNVSLVKGVMRNGSVARSNTAKREPRWFSASGFKNPVVHQASALDDRPSKFSVVDVMNKFIEPSMRRLSCLEM